MFGSSLRAAQLLNPRTAKSVIVAFDHGSNGVVPGGEDPQQMISALARSGADAVLLGPGLATHALAALSFPGAPRLVVALDGPFFGAGPATTEPLSGQRRLLSAEAAVRMGATAGKVLLPLGIGDQSGYADSLALIAGAAEECRSVGLPLMVEPAFWGAESDMSDEMIAHSARVSIEFGASLLKIPAPEDVALLKQIVERSPVPVYVLGGDPADAERLAGDLVSWMEAGAAGVVVGRNVWNRPDPSAAVRGLSAAVHDRDRDACAKLLAVDVAA